MNKEPLLQNENENSIIKEKENTLEGYGNTDAFHDANFFSKLFFCWLVKIKPLTHETLGIINNKNSSKNFVNDFSEVWEKKKYKDCKNNALTKSIFRYFICETFLILFTAITMVALEFSCVYLIQLLIKYFDNKTNDLNYLIKICSGLVLAKLISIFINRHNTLFQQRISIKCVNILYAFLFEKILKISPASTKNKSSQGEIVNYIQVDANKIGELIKWSPWLFICPIQIVVYIMLLFYYFGYSFLFGVIPLVICAIINAILFKLYLNFNKEFMKKKDARMSVTTETFDSLKLLKMYAWDQIFKGKVLNARDEELKIGRKLIFNNVLGIFFYWSSPVFTTITTIGAYQYTHEVLDINQVMVGLYVFSLLQNPLQNFPNMITYVIETLVSMKRIEKFIKEMEINSENVLRDSNESSKENIAIKIEDISFSWGKPIEDKEKENKEKENKENNSKKKIHQEKNEGKKNQENENLIKNDKSMITINEENKENNENFLLTKENNEKENKDKENPTITPILKNINLEIKQGEFVGVFGEVGSGKSSLIQSIMNNLLIYDNLTEDEKNLKENSENNNNNKKKNKVNKSEEPKINKNFIINGSLSYSAQNPWIQNETIENNIVFFSPFDEKRYKEIIKVAQLEKDLEILPGKDKTEIGEKGINLSGGQKARVSLARSIYAEKDIYLFDDPISALDADVGKKVFNECFTKFLANKTRILVTHNISYLRHFDRIIWLSEGEIKYNGDFKNLEDEEIFKDFTKDLKNLVIQEENKNNENNSNDNNNNNDIDNLLAFNKKKSIEDIINEFEDNEKNSLLALKKKQSIEDIMKEIEEKENQEKSEEEKQQNEKKPEENKENKDIHKIIADEDQEVGDVKFNIFFKYFNYMGISCILFYMIFLILLWQGCMSFSDIFLAEWTKKSSQSKSEKWKSYGIYAGFALAGCSMTLIRCIIMGKGNLNLAKKIHKDMIISLVKAPINIFHDCNPKGRILNRLSKDLESVYYTWFSVMFLLRSFASVTGCLVVCGIYEIYTLSSVPVLLLFGAFFYRYYVRTSRDLQRLEGVTKSPVLNIVTEVINGSISVRTFNMEKNYKDKFNKTQDANMKTMIFINGCFTWFGFTMDMLSILFLILLLSLVVIFREKFDPQAIGLIITYSLKLQNEIFNLFFAGSMFENNMVAMERCSKFTEIPQEKEDFCDSDKKLISQNKDDYVFKLDKNNENKGKKKEENLFISGNNDNNDNNEERKNWPSEGSIEFIDYSVKYRPDTPIVINNLSFKINPNEKVGIVGRTGSGKSTICNALFRIIEPLTGQILIDGEDISKLGLNILRKNMTIIPQDPCILKGTLKYNVDPIDAFSDEEIKNVLNMVGFNYTSDEKGIYKEIGEQGDNLSIGEKQLICIARAILRKSKIIVMDEATANIDYQTEENIQKSINEHFNNSTIITIAHRLKTIMGYDKILVLEKGSFKEFDSPQNLINNENSLFYKLYKASTGSSS